MSAGRLVGVVPEIPVPTSTVRVPPSRPSAMSISRSSPTTAIEASGTPSRAPTSAIATRDGLPTTVGRRPEAFAIAAVTMAPRLRIGPSAPA